MCDAKRSQSACSTRTTLSGGAVSRRLVLALSACSFAVLRWRATSLITYKRKALMKIDGLHCKVHIQIWPIEMPRACQRHIQKSGRLGVMLLAARPA